MNNIWYDIINELVKPNVFAIYFMNEMHCNKGVVRRYELLSLLFFHFFFSLKFIDNIIIRNPYAQRQSNINIIYDL